MVPKDVMRCLRAPAVALKSEKLRLGMLWTDGARFLSRFERQTDLRIHPPANLNILLDRLKVLGVAVSWWCQRNVVKVFEAPAMAPFTVRPSGG
jgi:hypothetical protein